MTNDPKGAKKNRNWITLARKLVYSKLPWMEIRQDKVQLPSGRILPDFHHVWLPDYVILFAETDDEKVLLGRIYKQGLQAETLIFPGGVIEKNEDILEAAKRELLEETGYGAREWSLKKKLVVHANYGCGNAHFVHAKGLTRLREPAVDDTEELLVEFYPRSQLRELLHRGDISVMDCAAMLGVMGI